MTSTSIVINYFILYKISHKYLLYIALKKNIYNFEHDKLFFSDHLENEIMIFEKLRKFYPEYFNDCANL